MKHRSSSLFLFASAFTVAAVAQSPSTAGVTSAASLPIARASAIASPAPLPAYLPVQGSMVTGTKANVRLDVPVTHISVQEIHLKPLFTTAIRMPDTVTSIAVGAPTLFEAEHKEEEPRIVFVKPATHDQAESNIFISLASGETVALKLISPGDIASSQAVDFIVDYQPQKSLFDNGGLVAVASGTPGHASTGTLTPIDAPVFPGGGQVDQFIGAQGVVAVPEYRSAAQLVSLIHANILAPNSFAVAIGKISLDGDQMTVSYSIMNTSNHWLEMMPPQIVLKDPELKPKKKAKKRDEVQEEQILVTDTRESNPKLAPGTRMDGSLVFARPGYKLQKEMVLLQVATSSAVDTPLLYPLPFVTAGLNDVGRF